MPNEYRETLSYIKNHVKQINFVFDLDLSLTIGGDLVNVTHPTGLRSPRLFIDKNLAKGAIFLNNKDIEKQTDHSAFLRETVFDACKQIFERMKQKNVNFDKGAEIQKVRFLVEA